MEALILNLILTVYSLPQMELNYTLKEGRWEKTLSWSCPNSNANLLCRQNTPHEMIELPCRSCAGTRNLALMDFAKNANWLYQSPDLSNFTDHTWQSAQEEFENFLLSKRWFSWNSQTPSNFWDSWSSDKFNSQIQSLCYANNTLNLKDSFVAFSIDANGQANRAAWIYCVTENMSYALPLNRNRESIVNPTFYLANSHTGKKSGERLTGRRDQ